MVVFALQMEGSGEGLTDGGGVSTDGRLVHHHSTGELGFTKFDVNIVDTVLDKDRSAMDNDLNAKFVRKRARVDSYEDDSRRGRLDSYPDAKWVHAGTLNLLLYISIHGGRV